MARGQLKDGDDDAASEEETSSDSDNEDMATIYSDGDIRFEAFSMYTEILRVNKQIHHEASSLLYTEGNIVIKANDLFALASTDLKWGEKLNSNPWRYNPLTAVAKRLPGGTIKYDQESMSGFMEPHIFAKFQKVFFDSTLMDTHTQGIQFFFDIDTGKLDDENTQKFNKYLGSLTYIKDFVKLLSKSQSINKLSVNVAVHVDAFTKLDEEFDSIDLDDEDAMDDLCDKEDKAAFQADIKATEMFMDANMFKSFKLLKNVRKLKISNGLCNYLPPHDGYKPTKKYLTMANDIKKLVEGNFKEPVESTRGGLRSQSTFTRFEEI